MGNEIYHTGMGHRVTPEGLGGEAAHLPPCLQGIQP
jgi:hypothetical protein